MVTNETVNWILDTR